MFIFTFPLGATGRNARRASSGTRRTDGVARGAAHALFKRADRTDDARAIFGQVETGDTHHARGRVAGAHGTMRDHASG